MKNELILFVLLLSFSAMGAFCHQPQKPSITDVPPYDESQDIRVYSGFVPFNETDTLSMNEVWEFHNEKIIMHANDTIYEFGGAWNATQFMVLHSPQGLEEFDFFDVQEGKMIIYYTEDRKRNCLGSYIEFSRN